MLACGGTLARDLRPAGEHSAEALEPLLRIWNPSHERLQLLQVVGKSNRLADLLKVRLDFGKYSDVLSVGVHEHLFVYPAVVDERRGHIPVRNDHTIVRASIVTATEQAYDVGGALGVELGEVPFTRAAKP